VGSYPSGHVIYMNDLLRSIMTIITKANGHFGSVRIASTKNNVKIFGYQNIKHNYLKKYTFDDGVEKLDQLVIQNNESKTIRKSKMMSYKDDKMFS